MSPKTTPTTKKAKNVTTRPPVVVILGHVDHGKTSILDYIRHTKVAETESGGITQHTGAYQVTQDGKTITFIDTPGHEAFSAMRSRGARVADIAVLVIAADDGVMPQTREAIKHIEKASIPFIVAITKIDKPEADAGKIKNQLLEEQVTLEGYGGDVPNVEVSAKSGQGIDELLDMINLVAELEEFRVDEDDATELVVIEVALDARRGATATLLVKKGILRTNDIIAGSSAWARVKHMEDFQGHAMRQATPSTPVLLIGFNTAPRVGERFVAVASIKEAEERIVNKERKSDEGHLLEIKEGQKVVNIIMKADAEGTLEAIRDVLSSIESDEVVLRMLQAGVGEITDSDVRLAITGKALLIGFRVKTNKIAQTLAANNNTPIVTFDTIYDLVEGVRLALTQRLDPVITETVVGKLEVLQIFRTEANRMIVGGKIMVGELRSGLSLKVFREGEEIGAGKLSELRQGSQITEKAGEGAEVGIAFLGEIKIEEGDILEAFTKERSKPSL